MCEELKQKYFNLVRQLVHEHGVIALTERWLKDNNHKALMSRMKKWLGGGAAMATKLMVLDDYKAAVERSLHAKRPPRKTKWTKEYVDQVVTDDIIPKYGRIPDWDTLSRDGYHTFLAKVRKFYKDLKELRSIHGCTFKDIQLKTLGELVKAHGAVALTDKWLIANKHQSVRSAFVCHWNSDREAVAETLGILDEYKSLIEHNRTTYTPNKWTKEVFDKAVKEVIDRFGGIPCHEVLCASGYGALVGTINNKQYCSSLPDLRKQYGVENDRNTAMNGMELHSFAEVSLANFLYERGIRFKRGERYPPAYEAMSGRHHGTYDFHIQTTVSDVIPEGEWLDVEVWGGPGRNHVKDHDNYQKTRKAKEAFHSGRPGFLGIEYAKCYSARALSNILRPYIGEPEVREVQRSKPTSIETQVINRSIEIASNFEGVLPGCKWFSKTGKYVGRDVLPWEDKSWCNFTWKVKKIGGFAKLRKNLQERAAQTPT
jgi:hypothetical protein